MLEDGPPPLHPLLGVFQGLFQGGLGTSGKEQPHQAIRQPELDIRIGLVGYRVGRDHGLCRDADVVEEELGLVQGPLTDLVQGLPSGDTGQVQGDDRDAPALVAA